MTGKVSTKHPQYLNKEFEYKQIADCVDGPSTIKRGRTLYLPMPSSMLSNPGQAAQFNTSNSAAQDQLSEEQITSNPPWWYPQNLPYQAYLQRARFPDICSNMLRGVLGIAMAKPPKVTVPPQMEPLLKNITPDHEDFIQLYSRCLGEIITLGRQALLIDINADANTPYFAPYGARSFINWRTRFVEGNTSVEMAVFQEFELTDPNDAFTHDQVEVNRVAFLDNPAPDETGASTKVFTIQSYLNGVTEDSKKKVPSLQGKTLDVVPLIVIGSLTQSLTVDPCPMVGVSDIALQIYMKSADLNQAEFLSCNPILTYIGVDEAPTSVGSTVAIVIDNPEASVQYTEPVARSLSHIREHNSDLTEEAAMMGAALIGPGKGQQEAAETVRLKQESSGATLKSMTMNVAEGLERGLKMMGLWMGLSESVIEEIKIEPNLDFTNHSLTAQEQTALLGSFMNRAISHETLLYNYERGGLLEDDVTVEEEMDRIAEAAITVPAQGEDAAASAATASQGGEGDMDTDDENADGDEEVDALEEDAA